jgi:hypothetical protein
LARGFWGDESLLSRQYPCDAIWKIMGQPSGPLSDLVALLVSEGPNHDENEVNQYPDAKTAKRHELKNAGSDLPDVEAMHAQPAQKEAQQ